MKKHYDLLMIGGGPAGAIAARTAAKAGLSACIVEKRPAIGAPVRCAEGIGIESLQEFVEPKPCFISAEMHRAAVVAPDGTTMMLDSESAGGKVGYVLDGKCLTVNSSGRQLMPGQTWQSKRGQVPRS